MDRIELDRIRDNPYQTRQQYNGLEGLAESILKMRSARPDTSGLLQVPPGREVDGVVELAAGHRRLRAFRLLQQRGEGDYATFPVDVQDLDDQAMADIAWSENVERADLTAIEEAEALRQAMSAFGWTQAEVGQRWGLSQSAVANKIRLLNLPEPAQAAIRRGELTERHGRVLLTALGKSLRIYERVAGKVIPQPRVDEETAATAREIAGHGRIWWNSRELLPEDACCEVCGKPLDDGEVPTVAGDCCNIYLCLACSQAARGWEPPNVAVTEDLVRQAVLRESERLDGRAFPVDDCLDCRYREERDDALWCLDGECHKRKKEEHYNHQVAELQLAVRQRWPEEALPPVVTAWGGRDLYAGEVGQAMVDSGHCGPHCGRLRFRYNGSNAYIRPVAELPFVYNCDNGNAYAACERRYFKSLESEDTQAAAKLVAAEAERRRKAAREMITRAEASVAAALLEEHPGAWQRLARSVGAEAKEGQSLAASVTQISSQLVGGKEIMRLISWEDEGAGERFEGALGSVLRQMGVGLLPGMEDLERKISRIRGFLLDDNDLPRPDLTPEQVTGNLDNLNDLADAVDALEPGPESDRLMGMVDDLIALFPGK